MRSRSLSHTRAVHMPINACTFLPCVRISINIASGNLLFSFSCADRKWLEWLERVHDYTFSHFVDAGAGRGMGPSLPSPASRTERVMFAGEWFGYLDQQGKVFNQCKGGNYKVCRRVHTTYEYMLDL